MNVHITKNRREPDKRVTHRIRDVRGMLGFEIPQALRALEKYPPMSLPFAGWHATRVNQVLASVSKSRGLPRATTYSFRRLYCQQILKHFDYDASLAKRFTLHCRAEVLAAFYDTTA